MKTLPILQLTGLLFFSALGAFAQSSEEFPLNELPKKAPGLQADFPLLLDQMPEFSFGPDAELRFAEEHRDIGLKLFMDFADQFIGTIEFQGFTEENGIADAVDMVTRDLITEESFFRPEHADLHLEDQDASYDFVPNYTDDELAERLQCLEKEIPMNMNSEVRKYIEYLTVKRRTYSLKMLRKQYLYFPLFEKYLKKHNMPDELKYLAVVESALKPTAVSRAGAAGLWQFMPGTGKIYGLNRNAYTDERLDPEKATEAACLYLKALHKFFKGDWELALASYNCGPGRLKKAIRRSGKTTFWGIYNYLPRETRTYVPMYVAVAYTMNHAEEHNLFPKEPFYPIPTETVTINGYTPLKNLAKELKICEDDLAELNPELRKKVVPAYFKNYQLKIPAARKELFLAWQDKKGKSKPVAETVLASVNERKIKTGGLKSSKTKLKVKKTPTHHTIRRGESLGQIALRYKVSTNNLRKWNGLNGDKIYAGKKLIISKKKQESSKKQNLRFTASSKKVSAKKERSGGTQTLRSATSDISASAPKNDRVHVVRSGDTLWGIAQKSGMSLKEIKKINGMNTNAIQLGQKIIINQKP